MLPRSKYCCVAGTFDTKGAELMYIASCLEKTGIRVETVDLSTSGKQHNYAVSVSVQAVAEYHPTKTNHTTSDVDDGADRGAAIKAMALSFKHYLAECQGLAGVIGAGGSGGSALVAPAFRGLPVGTPKVLISTMASGDVAPYVGESDMTMVHSVTDIEGLNIVSRKVLGNAAHALAGMVNHADALVSPDTTNSESSNLSADLPAGLAADLPADLSADLSAGLPAGLPAIGLTMFGVTTPCIKAIVSELEVDYDCLVFHATGTGGRCMENLIDSGMLTGVLDLTTTEIADMLVGGVLAASEDRLGAIIRNEIPYVGSVGALDMVNFGEPDSVPDKFADRLFHSHNPQVTLMRTTAEENRVFGEWIASKLNDMNGPVRFLIPETGISSLDVEGAVFHDPDADTVLFETIEQSVQQTSKRKLVRVPAAINDPLFTNTAISAFREIV